MVQRETAARPSRLLLDPFLYGVAAFALLVCGSLWRYLVSLADEGILLHGATRLLHGDVPYRDFFEVVPPGGFLITAGWMKVVGEDFGSARMLAVGILALIGALTYAAATLASGNRVLAALLAAAWAVRAPVENNHHWLTTAASMAAAVGVLLALGETRPRRATAFAAGLFAGLAVTVTHTRGVMLCVGLLAVWISIAAMRTRLPSLIVGMAVGPVAIVSYLIVGGALGKAFEDLFWFASQRYSDVQSVPFASFATGLDAGTVAVFPAAGVLSLAALVMRPYGALWREPRSRVALALALVGLLGAFPRPDIVHLNFTVPLACPLVALGVTAVTNRLRAPARLAVSLLVIGLCAAGVAYATKRRMDVMAGPLEAIPTARGVTVRRPDPWTTDLALLMWHLDRLPAGEPAFFYPYVPMLPYLTDRRHAAPLDVMVPGYNTPEQFRTTCARVVREARWLVVDRTWSDPARLRLLFPAMREHDPPEKRHFESALARGFDVLVHRSPTFELRRRGAAPAGGLCGQFSSDSRPW